MHDMVLASTEAAFHPAVDNIEGERRMYADGWVQCRGRLPRAIAHACDEFPDGSGGPQRQRRAVAGNGVTIRWQSRRFDLQTFQGGIYVARGAARRTFLAQDMPGFESSAQLQVDAAHGVVAVFREAEF